jgi:hypothetical protein
MIQRPTLSSRVPVYRETKEKEKKGERAFVETRWAPDERRFASELADEEDEWEEGSEST